MQRHAIGFGSTLQIGLRYRSKWQQESCKLWQGILCFFKHCLNTVLTPAFRKCLAINALYNMETFVIDMPLLGLDEGTNNEATESIQRALFQYFIDHQIGGQLIFLENINTIPKLYYAASDGKISFLPETCKREDVDFLMV